MADETMQTTETTTETNLSEQVESETPSLDALMAQLAQEKAEKEKLKAASDKASKEAAELKRQVRARQTAEEQEAEALAEAKRLEDEEKEAMRKELNHIKAVSAYKTIPEEKTVESLIEAVSELDHAAIASIIEKEKQAAVKIAQAEWMKTRPQVNSGQYSSMTKEQIMAIPDRNERRKAIAMNQDLF